MLLFEYFDLSLELFLCVPVLFLERLWSWRVNLIAWLPAVYSLAASFLLGYDFLMYLKP